MKKPEQDNADKAITFSSREKSLRGDVPPSLHGVKSVRISFNHVRDPFISAQLKSMLQTEKERQKSGDGSRMVKLHKPFPDLRPKHDTSQIRKSFNQQFLSEQRHEQLSQFKVHEQHLKSQGAEKFEIKQPSRGMER